LPNVKLYPIPVADQLKIELSNIDSREVTIKLIDLTGNIACVNKTNSSVATIETSLLPYGVYIVNIIGDNFNITKRIIKH
jgi:hypothetical protein